mgnify:CR=1 FL=1
MESNLIEAAWLGYALKFGVPEHTPQWIETRRGFFAGAAALFSAILLMLDPGTEPTDADLTKMDALNAELERFVTDLQTGRG